MASLAIRPLGSGACRPPVAVQVLGPVAFATVGMGWSFAVPARTPRRDAPAFFKRLAGVNSNPVDARALAFTILTGSGTDEVIGTKRKGNSRSPVLQSARFYFQNRPLE